MDITIKISTTQIDYATNQKDTISLNSSAKLTRKDKFNLISYEEQENGKTVKNVLKIDDESLTMIKYAVNISNMYFKEGVQSSSNYSTEYGNFEIDILTKKLNVTKSDTNDIIYDIKLEYEISIQGLFKGLNILEIQVGTV